MSGDNKHSNDSRSDTLGALDALGIDWGDIGRNAFGALHTAGKFVLADVYQQRGLADRLEQAEAGAGLLPDWAKTEPPVAPAGAPAAPGAAAAPSARMLTVTAPDYVVVARSGKPTTLSGVASVTVTGGAPFPGTGYKRGDTDKFSFGVAAPSRIVIAQAGAPAPLVLTDVRTVLFLGGTVPAQPSVTVGWSWWQSALTAFTGGGLLPMQMAYEDSQRADAYAQAGPASGPSAKLRRQQAALERAQAAATSAKARQSYAAHKPTAGTPDVSINFDPIAPIAALDSGSPDMQDDTTVGETYLSSIDILGAAAKPKVKAKAKKGPRSTPGKSRPSPHKVAIQKAEKVLKRATSIASTAANKAASFDPRKHTTVLPLKKMVVSGETVLGTAQKLTAAQQKAVQKHTNAIAKHAQAAKRTKDAAAKARAAAAKLGKALGKEKAVYSKISKVKSPPTRVRGLDDDVYAVLGALGRDGDGGGAWPPVGRGPRRPRPIRPRPPTAPALWATIIGADRVILYCASGAVWIPETITKPAQVQLYGMGIDRGVVGDLHRLVPTGTFRAVIDGKPHSAPVQAVDFVGGKLQIAPTSAHADTVALLGDLIGADSYDLVGDQAHHSDYDLVGDGEYPGALIPIDGSFLADDIDDFSIVGADANGLYPGDPEYDPSTDPDAGGGADSGFVEEEYDAPVRGQPLSQKDAEVMWHKVPDDGVRYDGSKGFPDGSIGSWRWFYEGGSRTEDGILKGAGNKSGFIYTRRGTRFGRDQDNPRWMYQRNEDQVNDVTEAEARDNRDIAKSSAAHQMGPLIGNPNGPLAGLQYAVDDGTWFWQGDVAPQWATLEADKQLYDTWQQTQDAARAAAEAEAARIAQEQAAREEAQAAQDAANALAQSEADTASNIAQQKLADQQAAIDAQVAAEQAKLDLQAQQQALREQQTQAQLDAQYRQQLLDLAKQQPELLLDGNADSAYADGVDGAVSDGSYATDADGQTADDYFAQQGLDDASFDELANQRDE